MGEGRESFVYYNNGVAIKSVNNLHGIAYNTLREIAIVSYIKHPNIINFKDVYFDDKKTYISMNVADCTLLDVSNNYFPEEFKKNMACQLVSGMYNYINSGIIHRDLKPSNILVFGMDIKIADFDSSRSNIPILSGHDWFTKTICSLWYRAPEILLDKNYNQQIDIWSAGCVLFELFEGRPLFRYNTEKEMIENIKQLKIEKDTEIFRIIKSMLTINPDKRSSINDIINNPYFSSAAKIDNDRNIVEINRNYLVQKDLTYISITEDWIIEVCSYFKCSPFTTSLAIEIFEELYSKIIPSVKQIQCIAVACVMVSSKYSETYLIEPSDFSYITKNHYSVKDIFECEKEIVKLLDCNLSRLTAMNFLYEYTYNDYDKNPDILLALYLLNGREKLNPRKMAMAAISFCNKDFVPLENVSRYKERVIRRACNSKYLIVKQFNSLKKYY